jgi:DNA-binding transcriptional MerR regulator
MKKNFALKKLYYSISEVSKITDLEQYVLRYWETEFEQLKPAKNLAGNRIYTNKDIKLILHIKKLLRDEKYTIEGAKKLLKNYNNKEEANSSATQTSKLENSAEKIKKFPSSNELSLFNSEHISSTDKHSNELGDKALRGDLKELRSFLLNLLDDIE